MAEVRVRFEADVVDDLGDDVVRADLSDLLTVAEVASLLGMQPGTWRALVARGQAPKADDPGVGPINRRMPRWRLSSVREYAQARRFNPKQV